MSILNIPASSANGIGVTGIADKQFDFKRTSSIIIVPIGFEFSAAECAGIAEFKAALQTHSTVDNRNVRIFPVHGISGLAKNDTAPTEYTQGFGVKEVNNDGKYGYTLEFRDGGLKRHANLREFNNEDWCFILVDNEAKFFGTKSGNGLLTGITGKIHTSQFELPDNNTPSLYKTTLMLEKPEEINDKDKIAFMDCDNQFNFSKVCPGIVELTLSVLSVTSNKVTVQVFTTDGGVNMYDAFDDEFAHTTAFSIVKDSDGSAVTISSAAKVALTKSWELSATYSGKIRVSLAGPATLAGLSIGGAPSLSYESFGYQTATLP